MIRDANTGIPSANNDNITLLGANVGFVTVYIFYGVEIKVLSFKYRPPYFVMRRRILNGRWDDLKSRRSDDVPRVLYNIRYPRRNLTSQHLP